MTFATKKKICMVSEIDLRFTDNEISPWGGLSVMFKMLERCGMDEALASLLALFHLTMRDYPAIIEYMSRRHIMYNRELDYVTSQQSAGNCIIICPDDTLPIGRTSKNADKMQLVYDMGRKAGLARLDKIKEFIKK